MKKIFFLLAILIFYNIPEIFAQVSTVTIFAVDLAPPKVFQGDKDVAFLRFTMQTNVSTTTWNAILIERIPVYQVASQGVDGGSNKDVEYVKIYQDTNNNGFLEADVDSLISSGVDQFPNNVVGNSKLVYLTESQIISSDTTKCYFIAIDISTKATVGNTISFSIASESCFLFNPAVNIVLKLPIIVFPLSTSATTLIYPGIPTGFSYTKVTSNTIHWVWNDNAYGEGKYLVHSTTSIIFGLGLQPYITELPADTTSWIETGLDGNTEYTRWVTAYYSNLYWTSSDVSTTKTLPVNGTEITVQPDSDTNGKINPLPGHIEIYIPSGTFLENVNITISTTTFSVPDRAGLKSTNVGVEITLDKNLQSLKLITITINYRESDIMGMNENNLIVARYDETYQRWIPITSTVYPEENKITGQTMHLSKFQVMEKVSSSALSSVYCYPNPYKPSEANFSSTALGNGIVFSGLTSRANIKIYNIAGELVVQLDETNGDGRCLWDTRNNKGSKVASGVYIYYIINSDDGSQRAKGKLAIIR